ncbi:MAG: glycosyltransferase family 4 protein [Acidobacteria bacterium]|nr:glycosyltransferase family 4 protein [Acidobacteriota bacterium]
MTGRFETGSGVVKAASACEYESPPIQGHRPRLGFIGPMVGRNPGYVTSQGEVLAALLRQTGYQVIAASGHKNRYVRLVDIAGTMVRQRRRVDLLALEVYSGRSFVVEDVASSLGALHRKPIIMILHGGNLPEFMARFPRWSRRVLRRAAALVAPSEYLARAVASWGFPARVIPNVVEVARYPYRYRPNVRPRLFWMRSFHAIYNPMLAIRVLARLRFRFSDATLVMAGQDKGLERQVQRFADKLGVSEHVRFPGFLDHAGKTREGEAADIFLNTTNVDNMPVAVVEACAMGLPVVSTAAGGVPDLLTDGETGLLVRPDDEEAVALAVETLVNDAELAARLSASGRRLAEASSWERVRPQWEQLFAEVMARRGGERK